MGGCFFHGVPQSGKDVAAAFFAGKPKKRTNCETDGEQYWLLGTCLARELKQPLRIARVLSGEEPNPKRLGALEFGFGGYGSKLTARHLRALGLDASWKQSTGPCINGAPVSSTRWYTRSEIDALKPPPVKAKAPRFADTTLPLFA